MADDFGEHGTYSPGSCPTDDSQASDTDELDCHLNHDLLRRCEYECRSSPEQTLHYLVYFGIPVISEIDYLSESRRVPNDTIEYFTTTTRHSRCEIATDID